VHLPELQINLKIMQLCPAAWLLSVLEVEGWVFSRRRDDRAFGPNVSQTPFLFHKIFGLRTFFQRMRFRTAE
jgi:hypothetical protein